MVRSCALVAFLVASVVAQELPDLPKPTDFPDLKVEGEWWWYKLLDTQFPHDVVQLLPSAAVAQSRSPGQPLFLDLPPAQYVLLEFFAPWCPHCQKFAPELVKAVQTLQLAKDASGAPIVEVRAVDCERLELEPACQWGEAFMFPKVVLGPRETLLGALAGRAKGTAGLVEKFPISTGQEVLSFVMQNVPNFPQNLPPVPPPTKNTPFFGWDVPPEGVVEPQRAPAQDLAVGIASLLHQSFSTLNFTPEKKAALLDLLQLLCLAGPGGNTCRQSACSMRAGLEQDWDSLITQVTISHDSEYKPITPFTVTHLDFSRVEHAHRWCERPWPDFAQEGWQWCLGRTPGSRGYTCGLWMVFHSLLVGSEQVVTQQGSTALAVLPNPPVEIVRNTVREFFGCQSCRDHFLATPITEADKASPEAQKMWLWSAHNQATQRIAAEELSHNPQAPPRMQWPSQAACPACYAADGTFIPDQVSIHIDNFYGQAYSDESQAGAAASAPAGPAGFLHKIIGQYEEVPTAAVNVEVFYFTVCPHCEMFIKLGLAPLIEAQLPADKLKISLLPMYPPHLRDVGKPEKCQAEADCKYSLAPLCALRSMTVAPSSGDDESLLKGARFAACDIQNTAEGKGRQDDLTESCAQNAGLSWAGQGGLKECAQGDEAMQLLEAGGKVLLKAMNHLHKDKGFNEPPSMPWVFLDGELLSCGPFDLGGGANCNAVITPTGAEPLPNPGSLLQLVCAKLDPAPAACQQGEALVKKAMSDTEMHFGGEAQEKKAEKEAAACENCAEVGSFHWSSSPQKAGSPAANSLTACAAAVLLVGALAAAWARRSRVPTRAADEPLCAVE